MANLVVYFNGVNAVGPCSASGVKIGDRVISIMFIGTGEYAVFSGSFAPFVIADDEILQVDGGLRSAQNFVALLERHVVID